MTLVYSDYPGAMLQNDLNLVVISPDGRGERHGNMGATSFPVNSDVPFDDKNNVEQVVWTNIPAGDVTFKIKAQGVTQGPQPFAWVWCVY